MKFLIRYWAQITGIAAALFFIFGWLWNMKTRLDNYVSTQQQLVAWEASAQNELNAHDEILDEHDHRLLPLEKTEELRERGLMK